MPILLQVVVAMLLWVALAVVMVRRWFGDFAFVRLLGISTSATSHGIHASKIEKGIKSCANTCLQSARLGGYSPVPHEVPSYMLGNAKRATSVTRLTRNTDVETLVGNTNLGTFLTRLTSDRKPVLYLLRRRTA